jgi:hypothetical protein
VDGGVNGGGDFGLETGIVGVVGVCVGVIGVGVIGVGVIGVGVTPSGKMSVFACCAKEDVFAMMDVVLK